MASNSTISITFKLDGDNAGFKQLANDADGFKRAISSAAVEASKLNASTINFAAISTAVNNAQQAVQSLMNVVKGLTDAYAVQEQVERQLETVMRQRMEATDEEIQSIKDLCSAQQELGVIGDEVQLAGAQQLAVFLNQQSSLEALIPAMNNLIAQQKGLNATNNDAVAVANLMGKAMQGNLTAIKRAGIAVSETQAEIFKLGSEEERAAALTQIISDAVGDMNAQLAQTDSGRMKQLSNAIGDVKEQLGKIANSVMPFLAMASQATIAAGGMVKLASGVKAVAMAMRGLQLLGMAGWFGAVAAAVGVLVGAYNTLIKGQDDVTKRAKALKQAQEDLKKSFDTTYKDAAVAARTEIEEQARGLKRLMDSNQDTSEAVSNLNSKYGEIFGTFATAEQWYSTLIDKSKEYARAMGYEAKAREASAKAADYDLQVEAKQEELNRWRMYRRQFMSVKNGKVTYTEEGQRASKKMRQIEKEIEDLTKLRDEALREADRAVEKAANSITKSDDSKPVKTSAKAASSTSKKEKAEEIIPDLDEVVSRDLKCIDDFDKALKDLDKIRDHASKEELANIDATIVAIKEKKDEFLGLQKTEEEAALTLADVQARDLNSIADYNKAIQDLQELRDNAAFEEVANIQEIIDKLKEELNLRKGIVKETESAKTDTTPATSTKYDKMGGYGKATAIWSNVKGIKSGFDSLSKTLDQNASAWDKLAGAVDGAFSIMSGAQELIKLLDALGVTSLASSAKQATGMQITEAAANSDATAQLTDAAAKTLNAHSWIPFVGIALGVAGVAAMIASMTSLPKFAEGGIAYGPTLGLFGEYAGASSNPEVVAPLDKLRDLIGDKQGTTGEVVFTIKGRDLEGILKKTNRINSRI